jgi:hypothetical protein
MRCPSGTLFYKRRQEGYLFIDKLSLFPYEMDDYIHTHTYIYMCNALRLARYKCVYYPHDLFPSWLQYD